MFLWVTVEVELYLHPDFIGAWNLTDREIYTDTMEAITLIELIRK